MKSHGEGKIRYTLLKILMPSLPGSRMPANPERSPALGKGWAVKNPQSLRLAWGGNSNQTGSNLGRGTEWGLLPSSVIPIHLPVGWIMQLLPSFIKAFLTLSLSTKNFLDGATVLATVAEHRCAPLLSCGSWAVRLTPSLIHRILSSLKQQECTVRCQSLQPQPDGPL